MHWLFDIWHTKPLSNVPSSWSPFTLPAGTCSASKQIVYCTIILFQNTACPGFVWLWKYLSFKRGLVWINDENNFLKMVNNIQMAIRGSEMSPSNKTNKIFKVCLCLMSHWWSPLTTMCGFCLLAFEVMCIVILSSDQDLHHSSYCEWSCWHFHQGNL